MSASVIRSLLLLTGIVLNLGVSVLGRPLGVDGKRRRTTPGIVLTAIAGVCVMGALVLLLLGH